MSDLLFNGAFGLYVVGLFHSVVAFVVRRDVFFRIAVLSVVISFGLHTLFLIVTGVENRYLPLTNLREALAFFAWAVTLCFLISHFRYPDVRALGPFVLPLVTVLMLGTVFLKASPQTDLLLSHWFFVHATFIFLAYGMLFVAFVAGILYLVQERELKRRRLKTFFHRLPSLGVLDDLFGKFLISGFSFMTLGLLAGVIWAEQEWVEGWRRDPKVLAALFTWGIYLVLVYLRLSAGWRGRKAAVISMAGFLSALFTLLGANYFGGFHAF